MSEQEDLQEREEIPEELGPLETRIRGVVKDDWPDWLHMKAIQISRLMDEDLTLENLALFSILSHLGVLRRIQFLEGEAFDTEYWSQDVDNFNQYVEAWLSYLENNMDPDDDG